MMHGVMFPQFIGISGWVKGKTFPAVLTAGRDPDCDVRFPENSAASRRHFLTRVSDGQIYIRDLNSTNGTFLRRSQVRAREPLTDGDIIEIGSVELRFREWSQDKPRETERIHRKSR